MYPNSTRNSKYCVKKVSDFKNKFTMLLGQLFHLFDALLNLSDHRCTLVENTGARERVWDVFPKLKGFCDFVKNYGKGLFVMGKI